MSLCYKNGKKYEKRAFSLIVEEALCAGIITFIKEMVFSM